jgi:glycine/D-amino acid oxidase-like deaminating enzyme/nitrite reductase/ring-hydroxylating ferredoxin subunit
MTPSEQSVSVWMRSAHAPEFPPLDADADADADVCVVGAGVAGLTTAFLLARTGKSVVLLDDGPVGGGQTRRTTAHLSNAIDDRYVEIERIHGEEGAKLAAQSHTKAIDRIEAIATEEGIDCEFTRLDGYLFRPPDDTSDILEQELDAARRAGLTEVNLVPGAPITKFDTGPALRFPHQAMFDPMKYLAGLARAFRRHRGRIFGRTHASAAVEGGDPCKVPTKNGPTVSCKHVVVATNTPINDRVTMHTKQAPYISYAIGLKIPARSVTSALYWDTLDPYHYVRLQHGHDDGEDILIVGGEDHKTGQADDAAERHAKLELWARHRWPQCGDAAFRWSGQVMETVDGLAFIGRNPGDDENVYIATGDSGMGMTHGTIAGLLLTDLILGKENPWAELYDPARKRVKALGAFAKENLNVAAQYLDWVTGGDVSDPQEIKPGAGAVIRRGLHKVAVYRDPAGRLHEHSATCPHLGCVVHWNGAEKTWDCPCHGSRFDAFGTVICGPANADLGPAHQAVKPLVGGDSATAGGSAPPASERKGDRERVK